jgi:hypothetical protein
VQRRRVLQAWRQFQKVKNKMRKVIGFIIMVCAVIVGAYAGIVWALIGGIVDVVNAFKAPSVDAWGVGIGVVKILFCSVIGWGTITIGVFIGAIVVGDK